MGIGDLKFNPKPLYKGYLLFEVRVGEPIREFIRGVAHLHFSSNIFWKGSCFF